MPNIDELIRDKLSKDGQVINLKAQFLREVGAKELACREELKEVRAMDLSQNCLLYTSPSPRDGLLSRMPSSA